jgi:hypothetical protein
MRLIAARTLVVLGALLAVAALFALYIRKTALDGHEARVIARQLIADKDVRAEVARASIDAVYQEVNVAALLRRALPQAESVLAGPLALALHEVGARTADELLRRPVVQKLWVLAFYQADRQLVALLEQKPSVFSTSNGEVVLDLRPFVSLLVQHLALPASILKEIPASGGRIRIMRASQLTEAQTATRVLNVVADWLWVLALGVWAGAIWLAPAGRRQGTLQAIAAALVLGGVALVVLRSLAGTYVVDRLVHTEDARPAALATWRTLTARLTDEAWTSVGAGAVALAGLWLYGARRAARARLALAPYLRRAELAYGALAVLLLLLVWWRPTSQTRAVTALPFIVGFAIVGVEVLRRRTATEDPGRRRRPAKDELVASLERLAALHRSGELGDEEFAAAKAEVIASAERNAGRTLVA